MFKPDLIGEECEGIHEVLMYSIQKSDMDLRKMLYQNIVLSGGSTLFKGFGDRLLLEIKKNVAKDMKIRVIIKESSVCSLVTNIHLLVLDCCTSGTFILNLDGWINFSISGYI